jgi:hypothetical protein
LPKGWSLERISSYRNIDESKFSSTVQKIINPERTLSTKQSKTKSANKQVSQSVKLRNLKYPFQEPELHKDEAIVFNLLKTPADFRRK